jgi:hypothetical protein
VQLLPLQHQQACGSTAAAAGQPDAASSNQHSQPPADTAARTSSSLPTPPAAPPSLAVQGRGGSTGYDNAVALPAKSDDEELMKVRRSARTLPAPRLPLDCAAIITAMLHHNAPPLPPPDRAQENIKNIAASKGSAVFSIAKVDAATGEIAGVFESIQPSDTDLGAKAPKDIKIQGLWYAQLK